MPARRRTLWRPAFTTGVIAMAVLVLIALIAPLLVSQAAHEFTGEVALPPGADHPLGTNDFGQDNLARALVATRLTLVMTVLATAISVAGGLAAGIAIWLSPRVVREWCLRLLETAVAYPTLITALIIAAILLPGATTAVIALGIAGIPGFARVTANLAGRTARAEYFLTARFLGVGSWHLATRHMIPSMAEPLLVLSTTIFATVLVEISALSFVGLGVQQPQYDLGSLLNDSLESLYTQPVEALGPAVMIVLASVAAMLIGDGLAAHANPRAARRWAPRAKVAEASAVPATGDTALVRVRDLRVTSAGGETELVHGIDLHVEPGEIVGLVGESGSGKSLTALSVAGLLADELGQSADELRVGAMNMLGTPAAADLAREIALIYQDPGTTFNPSRTMGPQLTEVLRTHMGVPRKEARARVAEALETVGITEPELRMRQHPHQLSGGMRQRAMIAAAVVTRPSLLIADEPTTALDVTVQVGVLRAFRALRDRLGTAILFISHDLGVVRELCDRVVVMRAGEVVGELTGAQLAAGEVSHPYTRTLLDAVPEIDTERGLAAGADVPLEATAPAGKEAR
ncbi:dipeptide/oligopeptide/nickel ABC transporter permease/ATP-binding protein [Brevibacterium album]|uniref:dipeptide/oligopeptide/nickel ABC transporter permease/ATP-binding protein n=1 Tax=Brevibacterium album TaxID=417948 RepID=UPI00041C88A3|nr:dipeptide/oligopeptide/nickel ABC transporter permease/ATP-binding protein [Brevibacterium album]